MTETQLNNTYFYFSLNIHEIHLFCLFRKNRSRKRRVLEKHVFTVHTKRYVDLSKYKKTSKGQVHETGSKQHLYVDQVKPNTDHSKHSKFYQCKTFWLHSIKNKSCRLLVLFIWGNDTLPAAINTFKNKKKWHSVASFNFKKIIAEKWRHTVARLNSSDTLTALPSATR